jgi:hypothetical protein
MFIKYLVCYLKFGPQSAFHDATILAAADTKDDNSARTDSTLAAMVKLSSDYHSLFGALTG